MPAMEPLEAEAAVVDDFLLNFSEDLFLDHDSSSLTLHPPQRPQAGPTQPQQMAEQQQQQQQQPGKNRLLPPHLDPFLTSFPAVEGELDWLNTRCEFPKFDFIPVSSVPSSASRPPKKQAADGWSAGSDPKRPSPVSVLEAAGGTWPVRKRSKAPRRLRAVLPVFRVDQQARPASDDTGPRRRCWHCRADETPQWRAGPAGPKTLCNACGVRYKSGRLVPEYRPANSPTFSSELHSNSHRKIIEMRRRKSLVGAVMHPSPLAAPPAHAKARKKKRRRKKKQEDANSQEVEVVPRV